MMHAIVDVFPKDPSDSLQKLSVYPEKNFAYWRYMTLPTGEQKQIFVPFMNSHNQVYYLKKLPSEKSDATILQIGKVCQRFAKNLFNPKRINFELVKRRLKRDPSEENRVNTDPRLGFKIGNQYLVKAYFTSGLRTVEPGKAHLLQTLRVPLLLYLYPKRRSAYCKEDRVFPYEELHLYDLSILPPMSANRIPPGTRYVLLTVQKTFFTFDVVPENYEIPFEHRDPVRHRLTKLPGCNYLDKPVRTPYIEHVLSEPEEEQMTFQNPKQQIIFQNPEQQTFQHPQQTFQHPQQIIFQNNVPEQQMFQHQQQTFQHPQQIIFQNNVPEQQMFQHEQQIFQHEQTTFQQQQIALFLVPQQEKSVNFAKIHQLFKESNRIDSEPRLKIPSSNFNDKPLDLSKTAGQDILERAAADILKDYENELQDSDNLLDKSNRIDSEPRLPSSNFNDKPPDLSKTAGTNFLQDFLEREAADILKDYENELQDSDNLLDKSNRIDSEPRLPSSNFNDNLELPPDLSKTAGQDILERADNLEPLLHLSKTAGQDILERDDNLEPLPDLSGTDCLQDILEQVTEDIFKNCENELQELDNLLEQYNFMDCWNEPIL